MAWFDPQTTLLGAVTGAIEFAVNWLLQSTLLIAAGLTTGRLLRRRGAALESAVCRTTLVAVLICPIATWGLSTAGMSGWSVELPDHWTHQPVEPMLIESQAPVALSGYAQPANAPMEFAEPFPLDRRAATMLHEAPGAAALATNTLGSAEPPSVAAESPAERHLDTAVAETPLLTAYRVGMAALGIVASWLLVSALLAARLARAWRRLAQLRRGSAPADSGVVRDCHEVASMLAVSAPEVLRTPYLPSPCLAGLRKPAILLPAGEIGLSVRDALVHELAHLKRRDCHWNLLRQAAVAVFFFQPLLWSLSRRIERAAEEVCDDYVIKHGGDRRQYAHRLVDIAELSCVPVTSAGVGVVSLRSVLTRRVTRIMDTSRPLSTRVGSLLLAAVLAGGAIGTTAVGLVGLGSQPTQAETESFAGASGPRPDEEAPTDATSRGSTREETATPDAPVDEGSDHEFQGKVVDPAGRPVEGAELYLVFHVPQPTGLLVPTWKSIAKTDAAGAFRFGARSEDFGVLATARELGYASLVAVKDGFGFAWAPSGKYETSGKWLDEARARLKEAPAEFREPFKQMLSGVGEPLRLVEDDQPIRGRIVDVNGQPVAGARLTLLEVSSGPDDDLTAWREAAKEPKADYYSARMKTPMAINGPQVRSLVEPAVTDADGRFTLHGVGRGRIAELLVEGPRIESAKIFARTEAGEIIELLHQRRSPELGSFVYYPAELTYVAGPSTAITGVVRDAETKEPLAGVTVKSQSRHGEPISGWGQDFVRAVSDEEGRYRLEGMPVGSDNRIAAMAPLDDTAYFSMSKQAATTVEEDPREIDFELRRGVWVEGRVTDARTGKGLPGRLAYYVKKENPGYKVARSLDVDQRDRLRSDDQGHFRIPVLPGPGFITFMADEHENYPRADVIVKLDGSREKVDAPMFETSPSSLMPQNYHLVAEIDPAAAARRVQVNLKLDAGNTVTGRAVDPGGRPVTRFDYSGKLARFGVWDPSAGDRFELLGYDAAAPRHVYFAHAERNLAAHVVLKGTPPEDFVVKLQPAGSVRGRLVDRDGAPLANCGLVPWYPVMRSPADHLPSYHSPPLPRNSAHSSAGEHETDAGGRFHITCLAPSVEYRLRAFDRTGMTPGGRRTPRTTGPLDVIIQVATGESKDLGDVRLADEAEFARAAKQAKKESPAVQRQQQTIVTGQITLAGKGPAAAAHVAVIAMRIRPGRGGDLSPSGEVLAEATTDDRGNYRLTIQRASSKTHRDAHVIARKVGSAIAWKQLNLDAANAEAPLDLPPEQPITGRLVDREGQPAAGVELVVRSVMKQSSDGIPCSDGVGYQDFEKIPSAWLQGATTDKQGRFTLNGIPAGHGVHLHVVGSDRFAPQGISLNMGMSEQRGKHDGTYRPLVKNVPPGEEAVLPLAPAQIFEGVVTYEDSGRPAPHARLTIWASQEEVGSMVSVAGKADEQGRYRISPNPGVRFGVTAYPPDATAYLVRTTPLSKPIPWETGDRVKRVDLALPRGVLVRGKVVEAGADAPVAGASIQYVPESTNNPHDADDILTGWQAIEVSDEQGRFEIAVLPGPGRLLVHGPRGRYVLEEIGDRQLRAGKPGGWRNYVHAVEKIDPEKGAEPIDVTLRLQPGISASGRIVDQQGQPLDEALVVSRLTYSPLSLHWRGQILPTLGGRFELTGLEEGKEYPVYFLNAERRLGRTIVIRPGGGEQTVVLEPCGTATARFVDPRGKPHPEFWPGLHMIVTPGAHRYDRAAAERGELSADEDLVSNIDRTNYRQGFETDSQGKVTFPALIPGATYRLTTFEKGKPVVLKQFTVTPGEQLELGDITIELDN